MKRVLLAIAGSLNALALSNPPLVNFVTYLGGPGSSANHIAVDRAGYVYVSGITSYDPQFCGAVSPPSFSGTYAFFTKLAPGGESAVWTICMPGSLAALALDDAGFVYIAVDATISKLDPKDAKSIFSTSIKSAMVASITLDRAGNIYVAGSATDGLTTTAGAYESRCGQSCGFAAKLSATGAVQYATVISSTVIRSIATDTQGSAWVIGGGSSASVSGSKTFIGKLDISGSKLLFSTSLGGFAIIRAPPNSAGLAIAVDSQDAAYAAGFTDNSVDLPKVAPGPLSPATPILGVPAGYIIKFDSAGNVVYSTYAGGNFSTISAVAVDAAGDVYLTLTGSAATPQTSERCGGGYGATSYSTLVALSADASRVLSSCIVSGVVTALALDRTGAVSVAGGTIFTAFLATPGAYISQYPGPGSNSGFAAKVDFSQPAGSEIISMVNAGSLAAGRNRFGPDGSVAPGEIVTLFGRGFVPGPDLSVTFDDIPAPILYSDKAQVNAVVPFEAGAGSPFTFVSVHNGAQIAGPYKLPIAVASPGLFTISVNGSTQLAALNEDGSLCSRANPAPRGSVISVFMTGAGVYDQKIRDGSLGPLLPPFPVPVLGVGATVDSEPVEVLFAGQAPGLVAGAVQVNLRIPDHIPMGTANVIVYVGNYSTGTGAAIEVR